MSEYEWEDADKNNPWGKKRKRGSHCTKGHEFTDENTFIRAYDKARVCRECRKEYAREKYQRNKELNNGIARQRKPKIQIFEIPETAQVLDKALILWNNLQEGLAIAPTPCANNPDEYADHSIMKSADEAEEMCHGCPLIKACYDFAIANEVNAGIWGGIHFDEKESVLFEFD